MRTTSITDNEGRRWVINHHSDWSGPASITRYDEQERTVERYELPGCLFREACRRDVALEMVSVLEQKYL